MNIVIHDLSEVEWQKVSDKYKGWKVISDNGTIKPCVGCFGCWVKTPGECVIKDGYNNMSKLLSKAEDVVIISRYTFGGFSSFVKNVIDRSIGYILPFLKVMKDETHHKARYKNKYLSMTVHFYGEELTEEDQRKAKKYLEAVCVNLHAKLKEVDFRIEEKETTTSKSNEIGKGIVLLNCSLRGDKANSKVFLDKISENIDDKVESYNLLQYVNKQDELISILKRAETIVFGMPLYVDGIPSAAIRIMEDIYRCDQRGHKKIYLISNMGFFESKQLSNLIVMMKKWCEKTGYEYCGGLAIGAGEMVGPLVSQISLSHGIVKNAGEAILKVASSIKNGKKIEDTYVDYHKFIRFLYLYMANRSWVKQIKANGLSKRDLYKQ